MMVAASTSEIRQWARTQGMTVGDRGRLPPEILAAYTAGQNQSQQQTAQTAARTSTVKSDLGNKVVVRPVPGATGMTRTISARAT